MPDKNVEKFVDDLNEMFSIAFYSTLKTHDFEKYLFPKPARLAKNKKEEELLNKKIEDLNEKLGGPPEFFIILKNEKLKSYNAFPTIAFEQIIKNFDRCRKSICQTHIYLSFMKIITEMPEYLPEEIGIDEREFYLNIFTEKFWENAEISYIKLASLWDRIGQLLDFEFFNIRDYERDGFTIVIDRIKTNFLPLYPEIKEKYFWGRLIKYRNSENEHGLCWLIRRRNLLVHSLCLDSYEEESDNQLYISEYNHLESKIKNKLKPLPPQKELNSLHFHLSKFSELFQDILELCFYGVENLGLMKFVKDNSSQQF